MTPLKTIAEAAQTLREALNVPIVFIAVVPDRSAVVLRTPLVNNRNLVLVFTQGSIDDEHDDHTYVHTWIDTQHEYEAASNVSPMLDYHFRWTPLNLIGLIGKPNVAPLLDNALDEPPPDWIWMQAVGRPNLQWTCYENVYLSEALGPRSQNPDDLQSNPKSPYKRLKVYLDRRTNHWTFGVLAPNGRCLSRHATFHDNHDDTIARAEQYARDNKLNPRPIAVETRGLRVLHYFIRFDDEGFATAQMTLSNGEAISQIAGDTYSSLKGCNDQFKTLARINTIVKAPRPRARGNRAP